MKISMKDAAITNTDDEFPGAFQVILSAPTKDRDGDTLLPDEWKQPLPGHITFDSDHGMSVATTVGSGVPSLNEQGQLVVDGTYSSLPRAQEVRTLVNEGHIKTTSVAFMTEKSTDKGVTTTKRELLNGAFVAVPSNREALVLASKGLKAGARNSQTDAEHIQAIHDHAVALGATPDDTTSEGDDKAVKRERKSVDGSIEATQDRARDALQDAYPGNWVYLQATIPEGDGGLLVFGVENSITYDCETFKQSYTDDGSTVTLTGTPSPVDLVQIIKPDLDEAEDTSADDSAAAAKAAAADSPAVPSPAEVAKHYLELAATRAHLNQTLASTFKE